MRLFVYSMREFDELPFFEKYCKKYGIEWAYTKETPCIENLELAKKQIAQITNAKEKFAILFCNDLPDNYT